MHGHLLVVSDSVLVVSMSRSFVAWVIGNNFVVKRKMTIRYCSSVNLVDSTHFDFYNLHVHVFHFTQSHYR